MKKQILTLTMCLALTATTALADGINTVTQKATQQTKVTAAAVENKAKQTTPVVGKPGEQLQFKSREEAQKYFAQKRAKQREFMYKDLGFTEEQKVKAEALDQKTKQEGAAALRKVQTEAIKLKELKSKKASKFAIWRQEMSLNSSKKSAKKFFESSRKEFEAILTKEQKAKMDKFKKSHKPKHKGMGPKGQKGPKQMGPPPEGMGPVGPKGPEPMAKPSEKK